MGQEEVYALLKKNKRRWFSAKEISERLNISSGSIINNLRRLRESKLVAYKMANKMIREGNKRKIYVYKFAK